MWDSLTSVSPLCPPQTSPLLLMWYNSHEIISCTDNVYAALTQGDPTTQVAPLSLLREDDDVGTKRLAGRTQ